MFDQAINSCFARLGEPAVYKANGGLFANIKVIAKRPDVIADIGFARVQTPSAVFDVRIIDVALPCEGDKISFKDKTYVVQGEPVADPERLVWTLDTAQK